MDTAPPKFEPGFRLSAVDVVVLIVGVARAPLVGRFLPWLGFAVGLVVAHFFLFCNVFRIARAPELIWAALFLGLATATLLLEAPGWIVSTLILLGVTVVLVPSKCESLPTTGSAGSESIRGCGHGGKQTPLNGT